MKDIAYLNYMFMFDPSRTWQHRYQFEQDLTDFFAAHGFEASIINTIEGGSGPRILHIRKIESIPTSSNQPTSQDNLSAKQKLNALRAKPPTPGELAFKTKYKNK